MTQPQYSDDTKQRINSALARAQASTRRAHLLGYNSRFMCHVYQVYSSKPGRPPYTVRAYALGVTPISAFAYVEPFNRILCECQAMRADQPCWHAAKVALRLQREARRTKVQASMDAGERPVVQVPQPALVADEKARRAQQLIDLYEAPLTRTEEKRAAWYAGKGGFGK